MPRRLPKLNIEIVIPEMEKGGQSTSGWLRATEILLMALERKRSRELGQCHSEERDERQASQKPEA
jgi:hypothetical protein